VSDPKHTPGPWTAAVFTRPDGTPILTVEHVAETVAHSALAGDRTELYGVVLDDNDESGRAVVVCYTGNGPNAHNNADLIAAAPDLLAACRLGLRLGEIAVRLGLHGFSKRDEDGIIRDHVDLKVIRAAIDKATAGGS
jgi:hypothetical protein